MNEPHLIKDRIDEHSLILVPLLKHFNFRIFSKEVSSTLKKSASVKEEKTAFARQPMPSQPPPPQPITETTKSPKSTRQESVERLFKAIRGTGRLESKSKKRETSLSPSGQTGTGDSHNSGSATAAAVSTAASSKASKKEAARKNAQEKRDIFKSLH